MKTCILYLLFLVIIGICVNVAFESLDKQIENDQKTQYAIADETVDCLEDNNY